MIVKELRAERQGPAGRQQFHLAAAFQSHRQVAGGRGIGMKLVRNAFFVLVALTALVGCGKIDAPGDPPATTTPDVKMLYAKYCTACHGDNGDGDGVGSQSLWPMARNFRSESFRLVSTKNRVPSTEDVETVIRLGMPGTSMMAFKELNREARIMLAKYVLELRRSGLEETIAERVRAAGGEMDEDTLRRIVEGRTIPSARVNVRALGDATANSIRRGRLLFDRNGCRGCHGDDGVGSADLPLYDESRRPNRARDLAHEPFKGGHDPASIALRIRLGMPGTQHPANPLLTDRQLADLVHYCGSLSREPKLDLTNHQRRMRATGRQYLQSLGR